MQVDENSVYHHDPWETRHGVAPFRAPLCVCDVSGLAGMSPNHSLSEDVRRSAH